MLDEARAGREETGCVEVEVDDRVLNSRLAMLDEARAGREETGCVEVEADGRVPNSRLAILVWLEGFTPSTGEGSRALPGRVRAWWGSGEISHRCGPVTVGSDGSESPLSPFTRGKTCFLHG
jgi:hypothetical protein